MPTPSSSIAKRLQHRFLKLLRRRKEHPSRQMMQRLYGQFLSAGTRCFDVGANVGNRVEVFLDLHAKVTAFEPQPACAEILRQRFSHKSGFTLEQCALGPNAGEADLMVADTPTISSMSKDWIKAVQSTGRFKGHSWNRQITVPVETLDRMIERYGCPSFIKIDVEGYEYEVILGLSQPVGAISLEFTPEYFGATRRCLDHLARLGPIGVDYSLGESMELRHGCWHEPSRILDEIAGLPNPDSIFGDVYVVFR